jgi:O-antigen/teichoic acid export membrane protein
VHPHRPRARRPPAEGAGGLSSPAAPAPTAESLARNTFFSALGEGSNLLLFALGFLVARLLEPEPFGQYSTAFAYVGLFRILPDFGMSYASGLSISRDPSLAEVTAGRLLGLQAVLSVATLVLCLAVGSRLYDGPTWFAVVALSLDLLLKAVKSTLRWLLKSLQRFDVESVSLLAERGALLVLGVAVLRLGHGLAGYVVVFVAVRLLDVLGLWAFIHARVLPLRPTMRTEGWWALFRKGLPFAYAGAMITLLFQVDAVLLERMRGALEVGFYRAPVLVLEGLTLVPRILGYALIPAMAALAASQPARVTALYERGARYLLAVALPVGIFGIVEADRFVALLFGPHYVPSAPVARVLIPAAGFLFLSNFGETTLACIDRWRAIVITSTLALVLNVALNLAWIPRHGMMGAAWATLAAEGVYFATTLVALHLAGHRPRWPAIVPRALAPALAFGLLLLAGHGWPLLLNAAVASTAWLAVAWFLLLDDGERSLLLKR